MELLKYTLLLLCLISGLAYAELEIVRITSDEFSDLCENYLDEYGRTFFCDYCGKSEYYEFPYIKSKEQVERTNMYFSTNNGTHYIDKPAYNTLITGFEKWLEKNRNGGYSTNLGSPTSAEDQLINTEYPSDYTGAPKSYNKNFSGLPNGYTLIAKENSELQFKRADISVKRSPGKIKLDREVDSIVSDAIYTGIIPVAPDIKRVLRTENGPYRALGTYFYYMKNGDVGKAEVLSSIIQDNNIGVITRCP
jgi:hypothetical protein